MQSSARFFLRIFENPALASALRFFLAETTLTQADRPLEPGANMDTTQRRLLSWIARWLARLGAVQLALLFVLFLIGEGPVRSDYLTLPVICQFAALAVALGGLLAAWRWEWYGAIVSLMGFGAFQGIEYAQNGSFAGGGFPLLVIPALLYLLANGLASRREASRI